MQNLAALVRVREFRNLARVTVTRARVIQVSDESAADDEESSTSLHTRAASFLRIPDLFEGHFRLAGSPSRTPVCRWTQPGNRRRGIVALQRRWAAGFEFEWID
jgi:hypothetical protein